MIYYIHKYFKAKISGIFLRFVGVGSSFSDKLHDALGFIVPARFTAADDNKTRLEKYIKENTVNDI